MRTSILATLATASLALAAPLAKRNNDGASSSGGKANIDPTVLNCERAPPRLCASSTQ